MDRLGLASRPEMEQRRTQAPLTIPTHADPSNVRTPPRTPHRPSSVMVAHGTQAQNFTHDDRPPISLRYSWITVRRQQQDPQPAHLDIPAAPLQEVQYPRLPTNELQGRRPSDTPYIHDFLAVWALLEISRDWTLTCWTWLGIVSEWILFPPILVAKTLLARTTINHLSIIMVLLAWCFRQELVGIYLCPSINSFCSYRYNPLSPLICPVEICRSYPNSTVEVVPSSMVATSMICNRTEQQHHIRTLFRIPYSMHWSAAGLDELNFFIRDAEDFPNKEIVIPILTNITQTIDSTISQADNFTKDYIHSITTVHGHVRLFESVFVKIIDDYAASACPNRDFLRHHNIATTGRGVIMNALFAVICKFATFDSAAALNATIVLQARFEEFITESHPHLLYLHLAASTLSSAISPLKTQLTTFSTHAASFSHDLAHRIHDNDNPGFWASVSTLLRRSGKSKKKFWWIDADRAVLKRCDSDLVDAMSVFGDADFRISQAQTAIAHLGRRLRELQVKDLRDGWGSASVLILTEELRGLLGWMDGGAEGDLKKSLEDVKEEEGKKWSKSMITLK